MAFRKNAASLQENTSAEVQFQKSCFAENFFRKNTSEGLLLMFL